MKKVLFIATISSFINAFLVNNIKILHELGYEVHIAVGKDGDITTNIPSYATIHYLSIERNPLKLKSNYKAYKEILQLIKDVKINFIDCHTPVGGVLGRLTAKKLKIKCIYTAHGFHFYKGAPLFNWLVYYPIEKYFSKFTDVLITINTEDYNRAKNKFKMKRLEYIPGVGVDIKKYQLRDFDRNRYRKKLGYSDDDFVILSIGELNKNKNHEVVLKVISKLNNPNIKYMIAGQGELKDYLLRLSKKLNISNQLQLLGFRSDIAELNNSADLFIFPSKREGLGLAAIEAMAAGLPIITADVHGMRDYSEDGITGYKCRYDDVASFAKNIEILLENEDIRLKMGKCNKKKCKKYDIGNVSAIMKKIYKKYEMSM